MPVPAVERTIDFERPWHEQHRHQRRRSSTDSLVLFTQYDGRFDVQRQQTRRRSRLPIPGEFQQVSSRLSSTNAPPMMAIGNTTSPPSHGHSSSGGSSSSSSNATTSTATSSTSTSKRSDEARRVAKCRSNSELGGAACSSRQVQAAMQLAQRYRDTKAAAATIQQQSHSPSSSTTTRRPLGQPRSLTSLSTQYREQQQGGGTESHRTPLRERRCKSPLSIKAPSPPATLRGSRRAPKQLSASIYSPPPCPPPTTPLPEVPQSSTSSSSSRGASSLLPYRTPGHVSTASCWDWDQAIEADTTPSSSTSPASSKSAGSSHRLSHSKNFPPTPPAFKSNTANQTAKEWSQRLDLSLALHLHVDGDAKAPPLQAFSPLPDPSKDGDGDDYHVYGLAL